MMKLTSADLDRLERYGIGGFTTYEEQMALIEMARQRDELLAALKDLLQYIYDYDLLDVNMANDYRFIMAVDAIARATGEGES